MPRMRFRDAISVAKYQPNRISRPSPMRKVKAGVMSVELGVE